MFSLQISFPHLFPTVTVNIYVHHKQIGCRKGYAITERKVSISKMNYASEVAKGMDVLRQGGALEQDRNAWCKAYLLQGKPEIDATHPLRRTPRSFIYS